MVLKGFLGSEEEACMIDSRVAPEHVKLQMSGERRPAAAEPVVRLAGPLLPVMLPADVKPSTHHALGLGQNYH